MTEAFKQWGKLLWEVARILGSLIGAGMKTGTGEIAKWANSLKKIADNLAKPGGAAGVVKWFKQSMDTTNKMLPVVKKLADSMAQLYTVFKPLSVVTGTIIKALPAPVHDGAGGAGDRCEGVQGRQQRRVGRGQGVRQVRSQGRPPDRPAVGRHLGAGRRRLRGQAAAGPGAS